jgi:hypothetical protein
MRLRMALCRSVLVIDHLMLQRQEEEKMRWM